MSTASNSLTDLAHQAARIAGIIMLGETLCRIDLDFIEKLILGVGPTLIAKELLQIYAKTPSQSDPTPSLDMFLW